MDEENPRRWLLLSREVGIPLGEDGREWMSLDHIFLDQDAIPTLVKVKRSSDTRVRREVVGQMLDYAATTAALDVLLPSILDLAFKRELQVRTPPRPYPT